MATMTTPAASVPPASSISSSAGQAVQTPPTPEVVPFLLPHLLRQAHVRYVVEDETDANSIVYMMPVESAALGGAPIRVTLQQVTLRDGAAACVIRAIWCRRRPFAPNDDALCIVLANANSRVQETTGGGGGGAFYRDAHTGELGYRVVHVNTWWNEVWKNNKPAGATTLTTPTAAASAPTPMQQKAASMFLADLGMCLQVVEEWAPLVDRAVFGSSASDQDADPVPDPQSPQ